MDCFNHGYACEPRDFQTECWLLNAFSNALAVSTAVTYVGRAGQPFPETPPISKLSVAKCNLGESSRRAPLSLATLQNSYRRRV